MWMQKSVEGSSFSGSGNFHDRNRFGSPYASGGTSYGGGSAVAEGAGDWKSKILESGQWIGGKVIEYGGKLARGPTSDSITDHYAPQMPRNDGRANWMADIRSSSGGGTGGYAGGYNASGGGYQNDFATERPKAYSDYGNGAPKPAYEPKNLNPTSHEQHKNRHVKKSKKSRKSKKKQSKSESESEQELSISESESESETERRHKNKVKGKKNKKKKHSGFYSDESESSDDGGKRKASADYAFSFDPAKLPPPPVEKEKESKKSKTKKSKKEKATKKSRARRQSIASTDEESISEKESTRKTKKRVSKKTSSSASVDLLGVDLDVQPMTQPIAGLPTQEMQPSVFDAPLNQNPLQDLAGLSFAAAPVQAVPPQPSIFHVNAPAEALDETSKQAEAFHTNLLPENNIVDFSSLASEKKKSFSANPADKRSLNDLQKARGMDQPTPVMTMPMQGQPMQNMPGGMMQLSMNMNQLQLTDGSTQQQMYPNMQMQGMSQPQMQQQMMMMQSQMGMMAQPQMMNMQQQFAQGTASMTRPSGSQQTTNGAANNSDPFHQLG